MKLSLILQAVDRMSRPARAAEASVRQLGGGMRSTASAAAPAARVLDRVHGAAGRLPGAFARAGVAARGLATRGMTVLEAASKRADMAIGALGRRAAGIATFGAGAAVAGGVGVAAMLTRGVISTGMEFENYSVRMKSAMGSADAAKRAMAYIQQFAIDTPYQLSEVVGAFIAAKNQGIDPMNGSMFALGDQAAAMGKTFEESALAVGDAMRNQYERLIDFGVTASTKGSRVTFSYVDKAGKEVKRSVDKNKLAIRDALLDIFRQLSGGGMRDLSKTMGGIWGNLSDKYTGFLKKVADAGIYAKVKARLQDLLDWADRMNANGQFDAWAKRVSKYLEELFDRADKFVHDVDWGAVVEGIASVTSAVIKLVEWWGKLNAIGGAIDKKTGFDNYENSLESRIWRGLQWDPIGDWMYGKGGTGGKGGAATQPRSVPTPRALPPRTGLAPRQSHTPAPQKVSFDINLRGDAARLASVGRIQSTPGMTGDVNRGRAMAGVA